MNTFIQDTQVVGETTATLFEMLQSGPTNALVTIKNTGVNTLNYVFQEFNGTAWVDLDDPGTDLNNTLTAAQMRAVQVQSSYPQVRLRGDASGGASLDFAIQRYFNRASGGSVPLLNL